MSLSVEIVKRLPGFTLNVSFFAEAGVTALLGASGSGKSMTLRSIAGVEKPDEGRIVLAGRVLYDSAAAIDLPPQERRVGYLFQRYALFPNMTVQQNIEAGLSRERNAQAKKDKLNGLITRFHLSGLERRYPRELSSGQMQRVAISRMLAGEPETILLDEPFAALDSHLKWQLEQEMKDTLAEFSGVSLLVSHDRGEAYRMSRNVCVLNAGTSEPLVETNELFARPRTLQGAMITGCKNVSPARMLSKDTIYIPDWNAELSCPQAGESAVTHAGIRAHYVAPSAAGQENALYCRVISVQDDVFSRVLTLLPSGGTGTIRAELSREAGESYQAGGEGWFALPRERILLLEETRGLATSRFG